MVMRWYRVHGRHALPWRRTKDPYHVMVSEIMLQQTQVDRVIPAYKAFLKRFPTLQKLAGASIGSVLRVWRGMGYNRRALYLNRAAQVCMRKFDGKVPSAYEALRELPGVGEYTANAILAFAFNKPVVFYDTNIRRIFSRVHFGKNPSAVSEKKLARIIARYALPAMRYASVYHGALMDFGSLLCRARPLCSACPMQAFCRAAPKVLLGGPKALEGRLARYPQSKFEGSDREIRGKILDVLRGKKQEAVPMLAMRLREPKKRMERILRVLLRDGLVLKKGSMVMLP